MTSLRFFQLPEHLQGLLDNLRLCLGLQVAPAAWPGFITAESMLPGCWQVAIITIGEFDREGLTEGTALFQCQTGFGKGLKRNGRDAKITDPHSLQWHTNFVGSVGLSEPINWGAMC